MAIKILAAPNAFKDCLTQTQAAEAMIRGIQKIDPNISTLSIPVSDGGGGLISAVRPNISADFIQVSVTDPGMRRITAGYLYIQDSRTAVIEMARASGLGLLPKALHNPCRTTTLGTGELIRSALDQGASTIILGIGGSATNDGGIGAATALGYRFLDAQDRPLPPIGDSLAKICYVDTDRVDKRIAHTRFCVACDVKSPLTGPSGAARVFGPQKGADLAQVERLDEGLANLAKVVATQLEKDIFSLEGAGAAGGMGAGMSAFFNADLVPGIDLVLELIHFSQAVKGADLVLTGEGRLDGQTRFYKAPAGVAKAARSQGVPCFAICGSMDYRTDPLPYEEFDAVFSICNTPMSQDRAIQEARDLLALATEQAVRAFLCGKEHP